MTGRDGFLLDTNILIAVMDRKVPAHARQFKGNLFVSVITLGELHFGARKSTRTGRNIERVNQLIARFKLVRCNKGTAEHYGVVRSKLLAKGRPIPLNDIWIAATAIQYGLTLITEDSHFKEIDGLLLEAW